MHQSPSNEQIAASGGSRFVRAPLQRLTLTYTESELRPLTEFLASCPYWDSLRHRTKDPASPHHQVSDIWAHYCDQFDELAATNTVARPMHWYFKDLGRLCKPLTDKLMAHVGGTELGFVLFTKIPSGNQVLPHIDGGWHAATFSKYCICIKADHMQSFYFPDCELRTSTGEVFWFDNSQSHAVRNDSPHERISMIICIKTDRGIHVP